MVLASLDMDDAAPAPKHEALSLNSPSSSSGYLSFSKGAPKVGGTEDNENLDKLKDLPARLSADGDMCFELGPDAADDQLDEESEESTTTQMVETELLSAEQDQPDALDLHTEGQVERATETTDGRHSQEPDQYNWQLEEENSPSDAEIELAQESSPVPTEHSPLDLSVPATIWNGEPDVEIPRKEPLPSTAVSPPLSERVEHSGVGSYRPGPYEFSITVDKSHGGKLGMSYDDSSGEYLTIKHLRPGLLYSSMQKNNTSSWLMLEDRIVEVNGVKGSSELLEEQCLQSKVLHLQIQRPQLASVPPDIFTLTESPTVVVHAYDLLGKRTGALSCVAKTLNAVSTRFGMFHTGVEVFGQEWYFGARTDGGYHGMNPMMPRQHPHHRYAMSVVLGETALSREAFEELVPLMRMKWPSWSYQRRGFSRDASANDIK